MSGSEGKEIAIKANTQMEVPTEGLNTMGKDMMISGLSNSTLSADTSQNLMFFDSDLSKTPDLKLTAELTDVQYNAVLGNFLNLLKKADTSDDAKFINAWVVLLLSANQFYDQLDVPLLAIGDPDKATPVTPLTEIVTSAVNGVDEYTETYKYKKNATDAKETEIVASHTDFYKWATEQHVAARSFVGYYCLMLMRCYCKSEASCIAQLTCKLMGQAPTFVKKARPTKGICFNKNIFVFCQHAFRTQVSEFRSIFKMALLTFGTGTIEEAKVAFFNYAIRIPFEYNGMHTVKLLIGALKNKVDGVKLLTLLETEKEPNDILIRALRDVLNIIAITGNIDSVDFQLKFPAFKGKSVKFLPFARIIDPRCFARMSSVKNKEFLCFLVGLSSQREDQLDKIWCLQDFNADTKRSYKNMGKRMKERLYPTGSGPNNTSNTLANSISVDKPTNSATDEMMKKLNALQAKKNNN